MRTILQEIRFWLDISQAEMANWLGIGRSLLSMVECGKRELPPDLALFLVRLHGVLKAAPEAEVAEKHDPFLLDLLEKAEYGLLRAEGKCRARGKSSVPKSAGGRKVIPRDTSWVSGDEERLLLLQNLVHRQGHRRRLEEQARANRLREEMVRVGWQAQVDFLRSILGPIPEATG